MTEPSIASIKRMLAALLTGIIIIIAYVTWQSYEGRVLIVRAERAGCTRAKLDRQANADGWRAAEAARLKSGTANDLIAAARYNRIATGLEARGRIDCTTAFQSPSLFPW
jgi:cell division protein FtsL